MFSAPASGNLFIAAIGLLLLLCGAGCGSVKGAREAKASVTEPAPATTNALYQGYALLSDLTGDESDVSKLKWIKHESPDLKLLTDQIAGTNRAAHKELEAWQKAGGLDLKHDGLPWAERAARKAISDYKSHRLLHSKAKELEIELLLSQNEALTYGAHLALVLSTSETNTNRAAALARIYSELLTLQHKVQATFDTHYSLPLEAK